MDASDNPLRMIYTALWDMLEANTTFTDIVDTGNRIRQDGTTPMYERDIYSEADLPSVRIKPTGHVIGLQATSNSTFIKTTWVIEVFTGELRFLSLLDVNWAISLAMTGWTTSLRDALEWQSKQFVHRCLPLQVEEQLSERRRGNRGTMNDQNRGNRGWMAVWRGEVHSNFTTDDMTE